MRLLKWLCTPSYGRGAFLKNREQDITGTVKLQINEKINQLLKQSLVIYKKKVTLNGAWGGAIITTMLQQAN